MWFRGLEFRAKWLKSYPNASKDVIVRALNPLKDPTIRSLKPGTLNRKPYTMPQPSVAAALSGPGGKPDPL